MIPPHRRRLFAGATVTVGLVVVAAGLVVNAVTETAVRWGWLMAVAGFVIGSYAFYLWIRLSD